MNKQLLKILALILLSVWSSQSYACSCIKRTTQEWYALANHVFYARLMKAELKEGHEGDEAKYVIGEYQLIETFKGNPPNFGKIIDEEYQGGNCSVGLTVSEYYIFFLYENNRINLCSGSHRVKPNEIEKLRVLKRNSK